MVLSNVEKHFFFLFLDTDIDLWVWDSSANIHYNLLFAGGFTEPNERLMGFFGSLLTGTADFLCLGSISLHTILVDKYNKDS